jgi:hypothetical protein
MFDRVLICSLKNEAMDNGLRKSSALLNGDGERFAVLVT